MKIFQQIKKFKFFLGPRAWKLFLLAILAGFIVFCIESSFIFVLQGFVFSIGITPESNINLPKWYPRDLNSTVTILVIFGLFRAASYMLKQFLQGNTGQAFICYQRSMTIQFALKAAHKYSTHTMLDIYNEMIMKSGAVLMQLSAFIVTVTSSVLFMLLGLKLAPIEMLIGVFSLFILLLPLKLLNRNVEINGKKVLEEWGKANKILLEGIKHHLFFKIYHLVDNQINKGQRSLNQYENLYRRFYIIKGLKTGAPLFFGVLILSALTFLSVKYIKTNGMVLLSLFYIFIRFVQSASEAYGILGETKMNMPSLRTLFHWNLSFKQQTLEDSESLKNKHVLSQEEIKTIKADFINNNYHININDISFGYDKALGNIFTDLSLDIRAKEKVVLKGGSGVGKSTLLSLILGLYTPQKGEVKFNDHLITDIYEIFSQYIAYLGPEPYLIDATLKENLLYGQLNAEDIKDEDIKVALKIAKADEFVYSLNKGLNTVVNEFAQFSTGQKQRLSIARALLRSPKIFVLDEATANLDPQTEQSILQTIFENYKDATFIIVSHKDSFDKFADKILELSKKDDDKNVTINLLDRTI